MGMRRRFWIIGIGLLWGIISPGLPSALYAEGVKTYYKQYSLFTYENQDYLCEPYLVKKNDWLYKIFRQKGEISASDFPKFLRIFKQLNPKLNNIDAIAPGNQILIPLKRVNRQAYQEKKQGVVEVPVLEFSTQLDEQKLAAFIHPHTIQKGDTVSTLLGKEFLNKGGAVSKTGENAFTRLNPDIKDINKIFLGSQVLIPDPAILSQPWFEAFLANGMPDRSALSDHLSDQAGASPPSALPPAFPMLAPKDLGRLKRYAQLIQGTLAHQGQMVFPGKDGKPPQTLDLTQTPLLTDKDGKKTLILPPGTEETEINQDLVAGMKAYWEEIQIQEINKAIEAGFSIFSKPPALTDIPMDHDLVVRKILASTSFAYAPPAPLEFKVGDIPVTVSLARITQNNGSEILINSGKVYGNALGALKEQGHQILTLSPEMTYGETILLLFTELGFSTWKNPAFHSEGKVSPLSGIYAILRAEKLFVTRQKPAQTTLDFLRTEGIHPIILEDAKTP